MTAPRRVDNHEIEHAPVARPRLRATVVRADDGIDLRQWARRYLTMIMADECGIPVIELALEEAAG